MDILEKTPRLIGVPLQQEEYLELELYHQRPIIQWQT